MPTINELRFVERGEKKILQQYKETDVYYVDTWGQLRKTILWQDVPFVTNEELQK